MQDKHYEDYFRRQWREIIDLSIFEYDDSIITYTIDEYFFRRAGFSDEQIQQILEKRYERYYNVVCIGINALMENY